MTLFRHSRGPVASRSRLAAAAVSLALIASACGSGSESESGPDSATELADTIASGADDASTGTDAGTVAGSDDAGAAPAAQVDGQYEVGDTYTDGEFDAVYLGLAEIPLGPDIWPDGACYAPIFELTYLDPYDYGTDQFRPSIDGYLTDGRVADDDDTGVGCDAKVFLGFGYERGLDTTLAKGETVKIYGTPFRVAAADIGMLDAVTLFGGPPETGLVPEVTLDLTS